jgi:chemosensory pili system protein ChpA (sensor histidine kinase/response regulator)
MSSQTGIQETPRNNAAAEADVNALALISQELMETIRNAHLALEDCVDGRGGSSALVRSGQLLHQVSGALKLTETYGAALLAEEMEAVCGYLANLRPGKGREDGLDALTRSMVQLPIYIERLLGGGRDIALVLLPILNDLRAARGQPLLSEGTLLLLNLSPQRKTDGKGERETSGEDPVAVATQLRPKFQLALLGWIKGTDSERHLQTLSSVIDALERASERDDMYQFWWVVGGVLESLQNGGLETSVALKRLLGQTDRQIKLLIDEGVEVFDKHPVADLLNNLLYYVARSSNAGPRISEIRAAFNLAELLPGDEQVEYARESFAAPSVKLMQTVASAIKEDLARVKDVLDIYVRTGMDKPSELVPQLDLLKKISDTLGVLGLGALRGDIDSEIDRLRTVVSQGGASNEHTIIEIASTLLRVEDRLDQQLVRLIVPPEPVVPGDEPALPTDEDAEYKDVAEAVMRESIINLARIKETFSQSLGSTGPSQGLDSVPALIRGIKAGLMMLNKSRAMEVVERIGHLITLALSGAGPSRLSQKETDRLADAIVSIEYYMETVKAGRSEPWYMLDNAEACLAVLRDLEKRLSTESADDIAISQTVRVSREDLDAIAADHEREAAKTRVDLVSTPVVAPDAEHLDPELLELFIEEAKEEIATIKRDLPAWSESPDDMETLITVRRSFHTLKGSGRMVGAERIAEYCWCIENLLNRLINRTLGRTPPMVEFILEAAAVVPELVEQLEVGTEPTADVNLMMARANAFAEGDPNAAVMTVETVAAEEVTDDSAALEMDPVLLDIFAKETAVHLKVINDYLDACEGHQPPFHVTDKLYRACHTLHGSANMANVERGVAVAGALNRYVRKVYDLKTGFPESAIEVLRTAANAIEVIVGDINKADRARDDFAVLIENLGNLADEIEPPTDETQAVQTIVVEQIQEAEEPAAEEPEYDTEIAAIFSEESAELLESADQALGNWAKDRESREHIEELKRHLHTLKGGARMAGIVAMGNLSHELEALLINIDDDKIAPSAQIDDLLQLSIDELHRMRDMVIAGKKVSAATELEKRIHALNAGDLSAAEAPAAEIITQPDIEAESVPVEFTPEPEQKLSIVEQPPGEEKAEISELIPQPEVPEPTEAVEISEPVELKPPKAKARKKKAKAKKAKAEEVVPILPEEPAADIAPVPAQRTADARQEFARIDADLLENLLNAAGEISIYHSRLSQQINTIESAGTRHRGTPGWLDAYAHGAVPAARPEVDETGAPGCPGGREASRTRGRGRIRRARPAGARKDAAAFRTHAAQRHHPRPGKT